MENYIDRRCLNVFHQIIFLRLKRVYDTNEASLDRIATYKYRLKLCLWLISTEIVSS